MEKTTLIFDVRTKIMEYHAKSINQISNSLFVVLKI